MGLFSRLFSSSKPAPEVTAPPSTGPTFGIAGHGLLLGPRSPVTVVHARDDGALHVRWTGVTPPKAAVVFPGEEPAIEGPPRIDTTHAPERGFEFGPGGPLIATEHELEDLFASVNSGTGQAPWTLLGRGFFIGFPPGFAVLGGSPDDEDPFFELHLCSDEGRIEAGAFIGFSERPVPSRAMQVHHPAHVRATQDGLAGDVRWSECEYEHEGESWTRRYYFMPLDDERTLVMNAGARTKHWPALLWGADGVANTFSAMGNVEGD